MLRYPRRPRSLPGLLLYFWRLQLRRHPLRTLLITALPVVLLASAIITRCTPSSSWPSGCTLAPSPHPPEAARVATFNIEFYPKSDRQAEHAFELMATLDASVIAVQEITDPAHLERHARSYLGDSWRFAWLPHKRPSPGKETHHHGVLYDSGRFTELSTTLHPETHVQGEGGKPTFEVRLEPRGGGRVMRLLVVHLKSRSDGLPLRLKQHEGLRKVVARVQEKSDDHLVLLGDFNATEPADRDALAALARDFGLDWSTEPLVCTAYWQREQDCFGSRLDHILSSVNAEAEAHGACKDVGCQPGASCPIYTRQVSDHCPVVATF